MVVADLNGEGAQAVADEIVAAGGKALPCVVDIRSDEQLHAAVAQAVLGDRKSMAFTGTLVTAGRGEGLVWAIGDKTESGRIAWLIAEATELSTPLTRKIAEFSRLVLWVILVLGVATFGIGVARGKDPVEMFMAAVALAVGAIGGFCAASAIAFAALAIASAALLFSPAFLLLGQVAGTTVDISPRVLSATGITATKTAPRNPTQRFYQVQLVE